METVMDGEFVVLEEPAAAIDGIIEPAVEESKEGFLGTSDVDVIPPVAPLPARPAMTI